ncbi:hypothetical protein PR048_006927 [Dryococelus australis]|uniref:Uncharacterized protein n=1 Tax=Dryococelus australis TaxID=614101 RepID=A0ABQ9IEH4_9NEOP|nr:hypothetical protein PR048_006927 [Dryococelus australis]
MTSISTNTCINPPLYGHQGASMNPWKIPDYFANHCNTVTKGAHIVHWSCIHKVYFTELYVLEPGSFLCWLLYRYEVPPFRNELHATPGLCKWEPCRTMSLVSAGFSQGSPISPTLAFRSYSILNSFHPHQLFPLHCSDRLPFTVTSNFSETLLKFYFQDIPPPYTSKSRKLHQRDSAPHSYAASVISTVHWLIVAVAKGDGWAHDLLHVCYWLTYRQEVSNNTSTSYKSKLNVQVCEFQLV